MSLLEQVPALTLVQAGQLVAEQYGVRGSAHRLPSERDQNVRIDVDGCPVFVLKVSNGGESVATLQAQHEAAARAHAAGLPVQLPRPTLGGEEVAEVDGHLVRLVEWLPGVPLASVHPQRPALLDDLGQLLGRHARALDGWDHPAAHRDFLWDVATADAVIPERLPAVADPATRALVQGVLGDLPDLTTLRRAVVHGDANDHNVLVDPALDDEPLLRFTRVSGLLDYGDLVHTVLVAEPAIAAAYIAMAAPDAAAALESVATLVAGFHAVMPLTDDELAVVWDLLRARLALSVCHAAVHSAQRPDDPYLTVSQDGASRALATTAALSRRFAHYRLREACRLEPHPRAAAVRASLAAASPAPLLDRPWSELRTFGVDLSVGSPAFGADDVTATPERFETLVRAVVDGDPEAVGIGGYVEPRLVYTAPEFAAGGSERRTVHLGVDVWTPPGAAVHAPLPGTVVVATENTARLDYGPMVVLEHRTEDGDPYWSLYGHLARDTVAVGEQLAAGDVLGRVGTPPTNGDWAPHVHVQLMLDLLDLGADYPGVAPPSTMHTWLGLSPDPALLLRPPDAVAAPLRRPVAGTLADRRARLGRNLSLSYQEPLRIVRGIGARLYDDDGRAYLDCVNNVAHVGHAHPRVVEAATRQMRVLSTNTRYLHETILEYARRLTETLPEPLSVCYLVNSGSEANELALRLVRTAAGAHDVVCLEHGYHGNTQALVEVSPYKHDGPGGAGRPAWVHTAALPDPYRGGGADVAAEYAADVQRCVDEVAGAGRPLAGMIAEPMVGCGGQVVLPDGYLARAAEIVRAAGGLFIADEVQVGFGRVGPAFWAFTTQGVVPDVVTMGKPAGNGHPLGVVVTTPEVAAAFDNGMEYFNTFGGNPVSAAVGLAVLDVLRDEQLPERAEVLGRRLLDGASALAERHPLVGDVRGLGLYAGIELVRDRDTHEPAPGEASYIVERAKELGVLLSIDGPHHNVLKIKPPLVWTEPDVDLLLSTLDQVLDESPLTA